MHASLILANDNIMGHKWKILLYFLNEELVYLDVRAECIRKYFNASHFH